MNLVIGSLGRTPDLAVDLCNAVLSKVIPGLAVSTFLKPNDLASVFFFVLSTTNRREKGHDGVRGMGINIQSSKRYP